MAEDLMNTQTGGTGETIQLQPEVQPTPDQFDVKINPPVDSEPIPEPTPESAPQVATVPTEEESKIEPTLPTAEITQDNQPIVESPKAIPTIPTVPEEPTEPVVPVVAEKGKEVQVTAPSMYPSAMSSIASDMETQRDLLGVVPAYKQPIDILVQPEIDLINMGDPIIMDQEPIEIQEPLFNSMEEAEAYYKEKEYENISSDAVKTYLQEVENAKQTESQQQKEAIDKLTKKPTQKYADVANKIAKFSAEPETYEDIKIEDVQYSPQKLSPNYDTFAEYTGLTNEAIDNLAQSMGQESQDVSLMVNNDFQQLDRTNDEIGKMKKSLETGKVLFNPNEYGINYISSETDISSNKIAKSAINEQIKKLESRKKELESKLQSNDYKILKEQANNPRKSTPSKFSQFEKRVNDDLDKISNTTWKYVGDFNGSAYYKSPVKTVGGEQMGQIPDNSMNYKKVKQTKEDAKWLNTEGRNLIVKDVKNGTNKFFSSDRFAKMSQSGDAGLLEYARDLYEIEAKKNYEKTKKIDPYSYDGFKAVARDLAFESGSKMNDIIKSESEKITNQFTNLNNEWISKNKPKLNSTIEGIKKSMDEILTSDILQEVEKNPTAQAIRDKYTQLIVNEQDPNKDIQLKNQMYQELKTIPNIQKSFNEYEKTLKNAVTKVQADYSREYTDFRQKTYSNAVNEMRNAISKGAKEVYREGINNDLNIYQKSNIQTPGIRGGEGVYLGADGVVKSKAFKEASFWGKRKMISDQWEIEKANITYYTKAGIKKFPANKEETGKHWSEWTGQRKMTKEEQSQAWKELPERIGNDARNRYIFYAVDDLLESKTGKPTPFGIKTYAKEELDKIKFLEKKMGFNVGDHVGDFDETRSKLPVTEEEESQLLQTKTLLNKIINHPETDQGFWTDIANGFADGFEIPILGSVLGIQRNLRLGDALDRYQENNFDSYDLSMIQAQASLNTLRSIKPPSFTYELGSGLGFTTTFMMEMAMFGGLNSVGRNLGVQITDAVTNLVKSSTDDVVRTSVTNMTPEALTNVQKVTAFVMGGVLEGTANPRAFEMTTDRMIDQLSIQESGAYDDIIVQVDKQGEGGFEAFMKAYSNYVGMVTIERLGAHMPTSNITKSALEHMGTSQFMKRTIIGKWMRDSGFRTVNEASDFLAANPTAWDNFLPEFAEEVLQSGWESLITGDEPVFGKNEQGGYNFLGMDKKEAALTALSVGIFGGTMSLYKGAKARIFDDKVIVETEDADGNSQISEIQRDVWNKFNSAIGDANITWQSALSIMNDADLNPEQQSALTAIFAKTRGKEILEDPDYQKWKEENKGKVEEIKRFREEVKKSLEENQAKLTEEEKAIRDYQYMTTGLQYDEEGRPLNYEQSLTGLQGFDIESRNKYFELINQNEDLLDNADMEIVDQTEEGKGKTTNVNEKAEELANKAKQRKANRKKAKEQNDKENKQGVSSEVREGQEPVETQPVAEPGQETPSPSGVVQEEQKITVNPSQGYSFTYESENDIPNELKGVTPINKSESTVGRGRSAKTNIRLTFSGQQLIDAGLGQQERKGPSTEVKTFADRIINGKKITSPEDAQFYENNKEEIETYLKDAREQELAQAKGEGGIVRKERRGGKIKTPKATDESQKGLTRGDLRKITPSRMQEIYDELPRDLQDKHFPYGVEGVNKPTETRFFSDLKSAVGEQEALRIIRTETAPPVTTTMFTEASDISKIKKRADKQVAETAFEEKHGVPYKKVSNINTNFASIVKNLQNNNLIEKEC